MRREAAQALYEAMRDELAATTRSYPSAKTDERLPLRDCVVPPLVADDSLGADFRDLLGPAPELNGRRFPSRELCSTRYARIAVDHGAAESPADEVPALLVATRS